MAYSTGARSREAPQWSHNHPPPDDSYAPQAPGYGSGAQGYGDVGGRGGKQQGPQRGADYSKPEQYDGYNVNPWSHDGNGSGFDANRENGQLDWNSHDQQAPPQHDYGRAQDHVAHHGYGGQGQQGRPPMRDQFSQESVPSLYDNDAAYVKPEHQRFDNHGNYGQDQQDEYTVPLRQGQSMPYRDRPQHRGPNQSDEGDQLPRYMNGHVNRFSHDSGRPNARNMVSNGATDMRPYGVHTSNSASHDRPALEMGGRDLTGEGVRPQTADGFRRNGPPGNHTNSGLGSSQGVGYGHMPAPANAPPLGANGYDGNLSGDHRNPGYSRSKTMNQNSHADPGLIPVENSGFQEPGAVSGYYGTSDQDPERVRPNELARSHSEDPKWKNGNVAQPVHASEGRAPNLPMESRAEIFDASQDEYRSGYGYPNQNRSPPAADEMPNFEASPRIAVRGQGMTIDDHLQPRSGGARGPPNAYQSDYNDLPPPSPFHPEHLPRSRSQPDFNGPPRFTGARSEDRGMTAPRPVPYDRPATSASSRDRGHPPSRSPQAYPPRSLGPGGSSPGPPGSGVPPSRDGYSPKDPYGRPSRHGDQGYFGQDPNRGPSPRQRGPPGQHRGLPPGSRGPPPDHGAGPGSRTQQPDRLRDMPNRGGRPPMDANRSQSGQRRSPPREAESPNKSTGRHPSLDKALPNPDALPSHPVPIRPGLVSPPQSTQSPRPPPIRQYNASSPDPQQSPMMSSGPSERRVTPQELEHLRQRTLKNPNDSAIQYKLAQKLAEAADVLVDERADPASRKRVRDRYQADSIKIIKKLSALSYADADFFYADCYSRGAMGLQSDIKEAFLLYQKAAKANHAQAAYRVAVCCELGQEDGGGTKRDAVKAMQWYRRAATLGDIAAKYKMGVILLKGLLGQPKNPSEGLSWLKQAAEMADKENPHSLHELALIHEKPLGLDGIRPDEAYSRSLFIQAANLGYKFSQYRLGCAYEYGSLGCMVDPRQSIAWYSKAAVQEEHQSELALSGWYLTGAEGILQQSDTEAYLWARKAAHAGLAKAEYAMGYYTETGIGAPANLEDAKRWYWKSASQNFPKARDRLEDLRRGGGPRQKTRVSRTNMRKQSDGECVVM